MKTYTFLLITAAFLIFKNEIKAQTNTPNDAVLIDLYQNQRYTEAVNYLKKNYPEPVTNLKVLGRFAYANQMAGKLLDAESYYLRIYQQDSASIPVLLNLANIQIRRENNTKALFYFEKVIALDKTNFSVYKQLGNLYSDKGETEKAISSWQTANKINPQEPDVAADLSLLLMNMKRFKQAEPILKIALLADSTNLLLLRSLAKLTYINNRFKETIGTCLKLVELGNASLEVQNMLGTSYFMTKNHTCALETFLAMPVDAQTERICYLSARSFKALKRYKQAVEYYDKTLMQAISPNTDVYYDEMADTYDLNKQFKNEAVAYQKGLFFKEKAITYYNLAGLYDKGLHDKANAVKFYKKYLKAKPPVKEQVYVDFTRSRIKELSR
ncbi:tetratricopeptide repeat protein [uncultured Mucilaginibacter sp.]|uniref:tetratricopeptide repeat protein n=1 Tax=uncultured Mucilaginibacter sp. TaxID=797541 RepID=UPI0026240073|nr:tetratricopeptide repeat protein [uncultured Mucilaginibacter sp.]